MKMLSRIQKTYKVKQLDREYYAMTGAPASLCMVNAIVLRIVRETQYCWSAEGVDVDYMSCGDSKQEAIYNFALGLMMTIDARVKHHKIDKAKGA